MLGGFLGYVVPFLFILTVLVFVHEMGHYLVARRNGVRVEIFSIGFGPEIFGWNDKAQTRWKFSLIPLGGYVKMFGDINAASAPDSAVEVDQEGDSGAAKPLMARQRAGTSECDRARHRPRTARLCKTS